MNRIFTGLQNAFSKVLIVLDFLFDENENILKLHVETTIINSILNRGHCHFNQHSPTIAIILHEMENDIEFLMIFCWNRVGCTPNYLKLTDELHGISARKQPKDNCNYIDEYNYIKQWASVIHLNDKFTGSHDEKSNQNLRTFNIIINNNSKRPPANNDQNNTVQRWCQK